MQAKKKRNEGGLDTGMIRAAIIGASGYSGAELMRLLAPRNDVRITAVTAATSAGQRVDVLYPALAGMLDLSFEEFRPSEFEPVDVAFVALPSGQGMKIVPDLLGVARHVIDLGGDFRLASPELYTQFYQHQHTATGLLAEAVYGLPELNREKIAAARLIANPGCYPTAAILALLPALLHGFVKPHGIVVNALSGISGAGRSASVDLSFSEINENVRAYKLGTHQHIPEMTTVLSGATGKEVSLSFVPHLIPITRGIYATVHAGLASAPSLAELYDAYDTFYRDAPFVRIKRQIPQIQGVVRTNSCDIGLAIEPRTNQLVVISAIDNLVKGAAGQAIQNMNIVLGLPESTGLR
jgi:N-acetyl-gamma-glutamyl-phosphate reductase